MNPETIESNRQPHRRLLGVGLAMLTAAGLAELSVLPTEASASNNPQATATAEGLPNHLSLEGLATESAAMKTAENSPTSADTAFLWNINCSGLLIKDDIKGKEEPVGVLFSDSECLNSALAPNNHYYFVGGTYAIGKPLTVGTGASMSSLKPAGDATKIIMFEYTRKSDIAMGVFDGYTTSEVYQGYKKEHLPSADVNKFNEKTHIDVYEPSSNKKDSKLQQLTTDFIAKLAIYRNYLYGEQGRPEVFVAIPKSESKNITYKGSNGKKAIGLPGYVEENGHKKILGIVTANYSLNNPKEKNLVEDMFNKKIDWSKFGEVLGFSYTLPQLPHGPVGSQDAGMVNVAPQLIDSYQWNNGAPDEDQSEYEAILAFNNPNITRSIVNGYAVVIQTNPYNGKKTTYVIDDPLIANIDGNTVLGYYDYPGAIDAADTTGKNAMVSFYPKNAETPLGVKASTGEMIFPAANANQKTGLEGIKPGSFVSDQHGEKFGALLTSANGINETEPNTAVFQNGQWVFSPSSS